MGNISYFPRRYREGGSTLWAMQIEDLELAQSWPPRLGQHGDTWLEGRRREIDWVLCSTDFSIRSRMVFAKSASLPATLDKLISIIGALLSSWLADQDRLCANCDCGWPPLDKKCHVYKDVVQPSVRDLAGAGK